MASACRGISEGIINALAQLPDLKVIARSSSFRFAAIHSTCRGWPRTLGVQTLVTGRIVNNNGQLTISAELVNGRDSTAMWRGSYTPSAAQVMDVEAQIAREIATAGPLGADARRSAPAGQDRTSERRGHSLLQRGRYEMSLYTPESAQTARVTSRRRWPSIPPIPWQTPSLPTRISGSPRLEVSSQARRCNWANRRRARPSMLTTKCQKHTPHSPTSCVTSGSGRMPSASTGMPSSSAPASDRAQGLAIALTLAGKRDEAVAEITRARELDPVGLPGAVESAAVFYNLRLYDRALATLNDGLQLDSRASVLWKWVGIVNGGRGDYTAAVTHSGRRFPRRRHVLHSLLLRACVGPGGAARRGGA